MHNVLYITTCIHNIQKWNLFVIVIKTSSYDYCYTSIIYGMTLVYYTFIKYLNQFKHHFRYFSKFQFFKGWLVIFHFSHFDAQFFHIQISGAKYFGQSNRSCISKWLNLCSKDGKFFRKYLFWADSAKKGNLELIQTKSN